MVKERNIVVSIILTFVTCGIYGIYWFICLTDEAARMDDDVNFTGIKAFLLTIVTCGIYSIYWNYKMGKTLYSAGAKHNIEVSDNSVLYLILSIFGLSIVNYCVMQSDLNKFANK